MTEDDDQETTQQRSRVTMAVLGNKMDNLSKEVVAIHEDQEKLWIAHVELHMDQEQRMRHLERMGHMPDPCQERIRAVELDQRELKTTVRVTTGINAAYATIVATLAAFFGK